MITGAGVNIPTDPQVPPTFYKPRTVPYAVRSKVEAELDRLEGEGVLEKVQSADWGAPIVPVSKKDGSVRICGDYKLTINKAVKRDPYPLPCIEDIFASLAGGKTARSCTCLSAGSLEHRDEAADDDLNAQGPLPVQPVVVPSCSSALNLPAYHGQSTPGPTGRLRLPR